jgi:hypothetical protein
MRWFGVWMLNPHESHEFVPDWGENWAKWQVANSFNAAFAETARPPYAWDRLDAVCE